MLELESAAIRILNGVLTSEQLNTLPERTKIFVITNPEYIRRLMQDREPWFRLSAPSLAVVPSSVFLYFYMHQSEERLLVDVARISLEELLDIPTETRMLFFDNASIIVDAIRRGLTSSCVLLGLARFGYYDRLSDGIQRLSLGEHLEFDNNHNSCSMM